MNFIRVINAALIIVLLTANLGYAEGSWLDKGISIFNSVSKDSGIETPNTVEIGQAFKEALQIGSENVVKQLGQLDGFNTDPEIHIPLPEELTSVKSVLTKIGMSSIVDDLELKLNRAAETATPKAKKLFWQAITEMTFDDVMGIYNGPDDSATQYFRKKMTPELKAEMQPIVESSLSQVGAVQAYDAVMGQYSTLPFVPDVKADLTGHVLQKGIDGIFYYIAQEEAAIRKDPAKQTTALLKKVFGAQ